MTTEERFQKIEENLLVQSRLVAAFERETKARLESVEAQADQHAQEMAEFRAQMAEFRGVVNRVMEALERFIAGRSGGDGGRPRNGGE
jgi:hypothetical protein